MITVDSPLEGLALNYVNFGILAVVNNLWTWIAVFTATVSLWRIRTTTGGASSSPVKLCHRSALLDEIASGCEHETPPTACGKLEATAAPVAESAAPVEEAVTEIWRPLVCDDGVTKGKLTVYYNGEAERDNDDGESTAVSNGGEWGVDGSGEWWERWERVARTKNGADSWYRYVDLTVINGNVVRLWDDNGTRYGGRFSVQLKL